MIKLNISNVLYLYNIMCKTTGGASGIRDIGTLESALDTIFSWLDLRIIL